MAFTLGESDGGYLPFFGILLAGANLGDLGGVGGGLKSSSYTGGVVPVCLQLYLFVDK